MLLLVPSNKIDEGTGKVMGSFSRVLVVLPPDTDLSSNVIVPDTAITTTLGTNTDSSFPCGMPALQDSSRLDRDSLGILRPSKPDMHTARQSADHCSQSTLGTRSANHSGVMDQRPGHPYGVTGDTFSRVRRHSHTGLVDTGHSANITSCSRMRSRQSLSCSLQYQHQQVRTPRALRAAFRKARRDQSPVLTSGAFSTEYVAGPLYDDDDMMLSHNGSAEDYHYIGYSNPRWATGLGLTVTGNRQRNGVCSNGYLTGPVDGQKNGSAPGIDPLDKSIAVAATLPRAQRRVLSETLDVEEVSDEEMSTPSKTAKPAMFLPLRAASKGGPLDRSCQDIDFDTSLDADMNVILGMASDMELVMPKFDDEYLDDLKNDPVLSGTNRRASSASSTSSASLSSPSCSHSSSTTITCISSHPSPESRMRSPRAVSARVGSRNESSSPPLTAMKSQSQPPVGISGPSETLQSPAQHELSTIHKDIDNLRRHRDSLRKTFDGSPPLSNGSTAAASSHSPPLGAPRSLQASSSSSSNLAPTNEQKPKGQDHIYFKPSHHALPERTGNEHQGVMIIQSNQWTHDNARVCPYPLEQGAVVGNNHIFTIQESLTGLPATTMPLDKNAIMTTNNISLATANMEVLTPQEVLQEDYYARRNLRVSQQHQLQQQRRRRRSSVTSVASAATSSAAAVGATMAHGALHGVDGFLPPRGTTAPRSCSSSHPPFLNGVHPLDKPALPPVHAIGPNPVPASYYIPPSAFRTEAVVAAEEEAERKRKQEEEELKDSFLVFPSPLLS